MTTTYYGWSWDAGFNSGFYGLPYNATGYNAGMYDEGYQFGLRKAGG